MPRRTQAVEELVADVLPTIKHPYSEDVIDEVCNAIEANPEWLSRYRTLGETLTRDVVNNWIGQYVADAVSGRRLRQVTATSSLIGSYSKLHRGSQT